MCEWHQLMYIAIITPSKPTIPPDFRCISPFAWQQSPKCQFFGQITTPKITLIYRQFLIQIICSKMKSPHLQQTSRSGLGIWLEVFLSTLSAGYTSAILSDPVLRISRCRVELLRFPFHSVEPPSTTSKISNPLNILLLQTRQNCLARSWNPSTKRPERQLHSWASMSATQHVWRLSQHETTSHLCFLSEACLYPHSSLRMPEWGLLQRKMARKTLVKRWFYQIRVRVLARTNNNRHLHHVTN